MFKSLQLQFLLAGLSAAASSSSVKREISDAHHSSGAYADSFPLAVTDTLGSGALSPLAYAGSLGNLYARDGLATGYEYPQYALGYGRYEPYTHADVTSGLQVLPVSSEEVDDDVVWGSYYGSSLLPPGNLDRDFGGLAARYGMPGLFPRPAFYYGRLRGYPYTDGGI